MRAIVIVPGSEVPRLLPMAACIDLMAEVLASLARGEAVQPLRTILGTPGGEGALVVMPGYTGRPRALGTKLITAFPGNSARGLEPYQGAVVLFDAERGGIRALVDATSITAIRTGAASGAATRALAREEAGDLAILGSGTQARSHLEAMLAVRPVRRVRVWSRTGEHARRFAAEARERHGIEAHALAAASDAVEGAELVCVATSSPTPVLRGEWLAPGAHVNAVGAYSPTTRELDSAAVARARLFVDRRESAESEAGDYLIPRAEGAIGAEHIAGEIGEVLTGAVPGRTAPGEVTLFKSLGLAVEDIAAAVHVVERAERDPACPRVAFG